MKRTLGMIALLLLLAAGIGFDTGRVAGQQAEKKGLSEKDAREQLLHAIGALAAGHMYQSYLNIGFLADGKAEGTYEEQDALQILSSVLALMDTLDKQLEGLARLELSKEDLESLAQLRQLSALLRQQADELQAFWKTGDTKRGEKYESLRQQAWTGISKLLELK